jgi:uncharacterized Zn-finger protein
MAAIKLSNNGAPSSADLFKDPFKGYKRPLPIKEESIDQTYNTIGNRLRLSLNERIRNSINEKSIVNKFVQKKTYQIQQIFFSILKRKKLNNYKTETEPASLNQITKVEFNPVEENSPVETNLVVRKKPQSHTDTQRAETKERRFQCETCDKYFTRKCNLDSHMRYHTKEKPFVCELCDSRFSQKTSLTTHIRTHTKEKPFGCELCDSRFSQKAYLTKHMRTHSNERPFGCELCDSRFSRKQYLTTHIRTHSIEKPFSCESCDKKFSDKSNLIRHIRTHSQKQKV